MCVDITLVTIFNIAFHAPPVNNSLSVKTVFTLKKMAIPISLTKRTAHVQFKVTIQRKLRCVKSKTSQLVSLLCLAAGSSIENFKGPRGFNRLRIQK